MNFLNTISDWYRQLFWKKRNWDNFLKIEQEKWLDEIKSY